MMRCRILGLCSFILWATCTEPVIPTPRPHQYPRIDFPKEGGFSDAALDDCPFVLRLPHYASISRAASRWEEVKEGPCWFNIDIPVFDATIHGDYYNIGEEYTLDQLINDAYTMASKHNVKASHRQEFVLSSPTGNHGLAFKIMGPVAAPYQFYLTDESKHFIRGSLYFNDHAPRDSVQPIIDYLETSLDDMLLSLRWKD